MADNLPTVRQLAKPIKAEDIIAEENKAAYDCLSCRVVGSSAFIGLGAYTYISGRQALRENEQKILKSKSLFGIRSRQTALAGTSLMLLGLGAYRLIN